MQTIDILPIGERILVLRDKAKTKTEGGIELSKGAQDLPVEGTVIALGSSFQDDNAKGCPVKIGDRVIFTEYTGQKIDKVGNESDDYLVMRPDELLAVRRSKKQRTNAAA